MFKATKMAFDPGKLVGNPFYNPLFTPDKWSKHGQKLLQDLECQDILPDYYNILILLECSCPSSNHHDNSRIPNSSILPCWFTDPKLKHKFGLLYLLKTVPRTSENWSHFLPKGSQSDLFLGRKTDMSKDTHLKEDYELLLKGLDATNQATQVLMAMLDLANLLLLWNWKLSEKELLTLVASHWVPFDQGIQCNRQKEMPDFLHPTMDLPIKVKQIRAFLQSLALDLITISIETPHSILGHLPNLLGQAICPLWDLVDPLDEFAHAKNFLDNFVRLFEFLRRPNDFDKVPDILYPKFKDDPPEITMPREAFVKIIPVKCIVCSKDESRYELFGRARSSNRLLYPREILASKPGEPVHFMVVCSAQCHSIFGDYFNLLIWTDHREPNSKIQTNASTFFQSSLKPNHSFPSISYQTFLQKSDYIVPTGQFQFDAFQDFCKRMDHLQSEAEPWIKRLLKDKGNFLDGNFNPKRQHGLMSSSFKMEDFPKEDLGSVRFYWQRAWLPVGCFAKRNIDDVLVVSHFVQDGLYQPIGHQKTREILELLVLEREFLIFPITSEVFDKGDPKMGVFFPLRRPKYRNNFAPESLESGTCYIFARRLDLRARNCIGGYLIPSSKDDNSWMGMLVPDLFDRLVNQPRLDATIQRLNSFQPTFEFGQIAKASIFRPKNSLGREEANPIKKAVLCVMALTLFRIEYESALPPTFDVKTKMMSFTLRMPNLESRDCFIILNFVLMSGDQFFPVVQHVSQKLDWVYNVDFIILDENDKAIDPPTFVPDKCFRGSTPVKYNIHKKSPVQKNNASKVDIILTKRTRIVFDGELLLHRMHFFDEINDFQGIALQDSTLVDLLKIELMTLVGLPVTWDSSLGKSIRHVFYLRGGTEPLELQGMDHLTLGEISRAVGHVGCHFFVYLTDDKEGVLFEGHYPPYPMPLFSRSHNGDMSSIKRKLTLMWSGKLQWRQLPVLDEVIGHMSDDVFAWILQDSETFENPNKWQTVFSLLYPEYKGIMTPIEENTIVYIKKNSTVFPVLIGPIWIMNIFESGHCPRDESRKWLRNQFGLSLKQQKAFLIHFQGPKPVSGLILGDKNEPGFQLYVPNDPTWIRREFPMIKFLEPILRESPEFCGRSFSKVNKKAHYLLGIFNALLHIPGDCEIPIFLVVSATNHDLALRDFNSKQECDAFAGSHSMIPILSNAVDDNPYVRWLLDLSIESISARFAIDPIYLEMSGAKDISLDKCLAFFLFRGTFNELRTLLRSHDLENVAKRSLIVNFKRGISSTTVILLGWSFQQDVMVQIVQALVPVLQACKLCECYKKSETLDLFLEAPQKEANLLWEQFNDREQFARFPNGNQQRSENAFYSGMLGIFEEERLKFIDNSEALKDTKVSHLLEKEEHQKVGKKWGTLEFRGVNENPLSEEDPKLLTSSWKPLDTFNLRPSSNEARNKVLNDIISITWKDWVDEDKQKEPLRTCQNCGREEFVMKACNDCRAFFFCNDECFEKAQSIHETFCAEITSHRFKLSTEF